MASHTRGMALVGIMLLLGSSLGYAQPNGNDAAVIRTLRDSVRRLNAMREASNRDSDAMHGGTSGKREILDVEHPKYFTRISEVIGARTRQFIFSASGPDGCRTIGAEGMPGLRMATLVDGASVWARPIDDGGVVAPQRDVIENVRAEVDVDSKILIEFDRCWIRNRSIEGIVTISGRIQSPAGSREIEVRGYSEVGKARSPAPALMRSQSRLRSAAAQFLGAMRDVRSTLGRIETEAESGTASQDERFKTSVARRDSTIQWAAAAEDSASRYRVQGDSVAAQSYLARAFYLRRMADTLSRQVDVARSAASRARRAAQSADATRKAYLTFVQYTALISQPLASLRADSGVLITQMALLSDRDASTLSSVASMVQDSLLSRLTPFKVPVDTAGMREYWEAIDRFRVMTAELERAAQPVADPLQEPRDNERVFLVDLRDAEILLSETGAKAGDLITISIADSTRGRPGTRVLQVRLKVREFGLVRSIADGALLIRRRGVDGKSGDVALDTARRQFTSTGRVAPVEVPLPANFVPAAGVNLLWTAYLRPHQNMLLRTVRWLAPGAGLNVSFTNFPSQTVSFSAPDTVGGEPRETVTPAKTDVQLAAGFIVTLFDNRLLLSRGWNLNVSEYRGYYALGFSFVNIAKRFSLSGGDANP